MNKTTLLSIRLILLSFLVIVGCSSDSLFNTNFPAGGNRGTGDVIDLQAVSGELGAGQDNLAPVGSGEIELTNIGVDDGSLFFPAATTSLSTQQNNFTDLKASFELWVATAEPSHVDNAESIAVGNPDFTWDATTEQVTENIYDFKSIVNFEKAVDGSFAPVAEADYTAFLRIAVKDGDTVVQRDAFLSIKRILCIVRADFEPSNDASLFQPPGVVTDPPEIINFEAASQTIKQGESTTLYWWVSGTPKVLTIDNGVGDVVNSVRAEVSPTETTTYTLTASNDSSSDVVSSQVTIIVEP